MSVADNYVFSVDWALAEHIAMFILMLIVGVRTNIRLNKKILRPILTVAMCIPAYFYISYLWQDNLERNTGLNDTLFNAKYMHSKDGFFVSFILDIHFLQIEEPKNYSDEYALSLLNEQEVEKVETPEELPDIIAIMDETFSDPAVLGEFETNKDYMPFVHSILRGEVANTISGYTDVSVLGGNTANSEFEFLTGNSMAFLPSGSVVYQQYISDTPTSIVSNLKNIGYTCVAMHPYYETGWSRNAVYPTMGFDETHFIDDFDQTKLLRKYITDQELYESIVERYESKKANEDLFIMSISMQNHGGYTEKYPNFNEQIRTLGASYSDANQYLSLLHESDKALEYLISYFQSVDDPVEIVFFGDHQPSLNTNFYKGLNGKGLSGLTEDELENLYTVPFFIWTNYETETEEVPITSLNYLSTMALERAGIALPSYNQFLADMQQTIPAINSRGYYSVSSGCFKHLEEATGEEAEWIDKYQILQYNNMFDKKKQSKVFFPYLQE